MHVRAEKTETRQIAIWLEPEEGDRCLGVCIAISDTMSDATIEATRVLASAILAVNTLTA
jgi:hypothetical protein